MGDFTIRIQGSQKLLAELSRDDESGDHVVTLTVDCLCAASACGLVGPSEDAPSDGPEDENQQSRSEEPPKTTPPNDWDW